MLSSIPEDRQTDRQTDQAYLCEELSSRRILRETRLESHPGDKNSLDLYGYLRVSYMDESDESICSGRSARYGFALACP